MFCQGTLSGPALVISESLQMSCQGHYRKELKPSHKCSVLGTLTRCFMQTIPYELFHHLVAGRPSTDKDRSKKQQG